MSGQSRHMRGAIKNLMAEVERQILPDGGHVSRNPGALIEVLLDLLPLRQAFSARNIAPPPALNNAIDRMMPMLRFFRHGDGNFAHFNGMGPTSPDLIATILAYDDARGAPLANAPHSGYQRARGDGPGAADGHRRVAAARHEPGGARRLPVVRAVAPAAAHRGELRPAAHRPRDLAAGRARHRRAFDRGVQRHVVVPLPRRRLVQAHDRHADRARPGARAGRARGPRRRADHLRASHDGYADRFSVVHQRAIKVAIDGTRVDGEDLFVPSDGDLLPANVPDEFAVRFHLHPSIKANRLTDGHGVMLMLPNREVWTFNAHEDRVELEESVYLSGSDGPRRTVQIVIYGRARKMPRVHWSFAHVTQPGAGKGRGKGEEPELPL